MTDQQMQYLINHHATVDGDNVTLSLLAFNELVAQAARARDPIKEFLYPDKELTYLEMATAIQMIDNTKGSN